jgi:hypothetical protein
VAGQTVIFRWQPLQPTLENDTGRVRRSGSGVPPPDNRPKDIRFIRFVVTGPGSASRRRETIGWIAINPARKTYRIERACGNRRGKVFRHASSLLTIQKWDVRQFWPICRTAACCQSAGRESWPASVFRPDRCDGLQCRPAAMGFQSGAPSPRSHEYNAREGLLPRLIHRAIPDSAVRSCDLLTRHYGA